MKTVFAAIIEHEHGTNLYLAQSAEGLEHQLDEFVSQYWVKEFGKKPKSAAARIERYFDANTEESMINYGATEVSE